jgi:hypothetical protein
MPPDYIGFPSLIKTINIPDLHWSFTGPRPDIDIGRVLNEVEKDGGVIAIIETENEIPYTFVVYTELKPAWKDKYPGQYFPMVVFPFMQTPVTNSGWLRWNSTVDPVQLLKEYREKTKPVRTKVNGFK